MAHSGNVAGRGMAWRGWAWAPMAHSGNKARPGLARQGGAGRGKGAYGAEITKER